MSEIGDIMEYNEEISKLNKKKRNAKELYYKYRESHIKATQKWKEKNQDKVKEYEKKRYEKRKHLIEEKDKEIERLNKENEYLNNKHEKIIHNIMEFIDKNTFNHRNTGERILTLHGKGILDLLDICLGSDKE